MREQARLPGPNVLQPCCSAHLVAAKVFVFPLSPTDQSGINRKEHLAQCGPIKSTVILNPAKQSRTRSVRQLRQTQVMTVQCTATTQLLPHRLCSPVADRWQEAYRQLTHPIPDTSRSERIAQEVELTERIAGLPVGLLAVHDFGLFRMQIQLAFGQPPLQSLPKLARLRFALAMTDDVISITFERHARMMLLHPPVKRVVEKQVSQQWTDDTALRRAPVRMHHRPVRH